MIEVTHLCKKFGTFQAVKDLSFSVPQGQVLGFLGPNGAGKSTTMKMLTGFLKPTSGKATINGAEVTKDSLTVRRQIGYLPESSPSYGEMTVAEFLEFVAEMRGYSGSQIKVKLDRAVKLCFLGEVIHQPIETLSKGFKQRVGFAQALIHDPPVLILDEPTDGLDPNQKHEVRQLIKQMGDSKTIILSTHILEEVEAVCQRAIIIANGQIVADESPEALVRKSKLHNALTIKFPENQLESAKQVLAEAREVDKVEHNHSSPGELRVFPKDGELILSTVSSLLKEKNMTPEKLLLEKGRLDDVFRKVTLGSHSESAH